MDNTTLITATITFSIAFLGFIATYINNLRLNQRQAHLDRVNRQLSELYGPLLAIRGASKQAAEYFVEKYGFRPGYIRSGEASEEDLEAWRLWIKTVFTPGNRRIYELILTKADLLLDNNMPQVLLAFCGHVLAYEVVLKKWEDEDFSEHTSVISFPESLDDYVKRSFELLKQEQWRLLGSRTLTRSNV